MKITDVTITVFTWKIPIEIEGTHFLPATKSSEIGLLTISTDEGVKGHCFLGTLRYPVKYDDQPSSTISSPC